MLGLTNSSESCASRSPKQESVLKKSASLPAKSDSAPDSSQKALPRKRSIFKSKDDGDKKRATYNHKWHSTNEEKEEE